MKKGGKEGVASSDGVSHLDAGGVLPGPGVVAEKTGAALAGGETDGGVREGVGKLTGQGFGGTGLAGELGGFVFVQFEEGGGGGKFADEVERIEGRAEIDVEGEEGGG